MLVASASELLAKLLAIASGAERRAGNDLRHLAWPWSVGHRDGAPSEPEMKINLERQPPERRRSSAARPAAAIAALLAGAVAVALPLAQGVLKLRDVGRSYSRAVSTMWLAIFVLAMAWAMREICGTLGTANYLVAMLGGNLPLWLLPLLTFLVAAVMSFATGTSWATMGILIPIMMPLAAEMGALEPGAFVIYLLTAAAVLDGAIFGDHCSPISDTTVLSSISSGCDHIAHVNTQLYYALSTVVLSSIFGYFSVAQGMPVWLFYLLYPAAVFGLLRAFGRSATEEVSSGDVAEGDVAPPLR